MPMDWEIKIDGFTYYLKKSRNTHRKNVREHIFETKFREPHTCPVCDQEVVQPFKQFEVEVTLRRGNLR